MDFLQSRGKTKIGEKSLDSHRQDDGDKIPKKNVDLFGDLEDSSSEEEKVCRPRPKKKLKIAENEPSRDRAVRPRTDKHSGAGQDAGEDGETVAPRTDRSPTGRESNSETLSNLETVREPSEPDRPMESQGSNASTIDSILFDLRSKTVNLKEFLDRHGALEFGGKNPAFVKCVSVERKYEPCKCHPTKVDRGVDGIANRVLALGKPSKGLGAWFCRIFFEITEIMFCNIEFVNNIVLKYIHIFII